MKYEKLPLENGCNQTGISCVMVYRFTEEKVQMPFVKHPYLYIVFYSFDGDSFKFFAREKSKEIGIDISFAISNENDLPRVYCRYGEVLVLSITFVPEKAHTAVVMQCKKKDVASASTEGASLMAMQTNAQRITLVAGGYPLFVNGKDMEVMIKNDAVWNADIN